MDEKQFLELISQHQGIIHKICRVHRDSREEREDLFQEIVYQLWKSAPSFESRSAFSTWLYRVSLTTAIAVFRKKRPEIIYTPVLPERLELPTEPSEQGELLLQVLKTLNDADKAIITLHLEALSYQEIAEITGISESNVGVRLNRIKKKIQQQLKLKQ
ncbi:MAG: sigma-70 family RNA polymerase sigma factor [Chitinophagaceae bacterium]|nr:MAG: sigma-70 family RNA polymerase sigma factor [Chitinophagaceae bacterium]